MEPKPTLPEKREFRCPGCHKLLIIGRFVGWFEMVCPRCGKKTVFTD